jgi:hypothetical protein
MPRRRTGHGPQDKFTLLLPRELSALIDRAVARTGSTKAHFLRDLIQTHVRELLDEPGPTGKRRLSLELGRETALLLQRTAESKGIGLQDMAQLILTESVSAYYNRGLQEIAERVAALEQSKPESAKKNT